MILSSLDILRIAGPDAERFLQNQLTIDVTILAPHTCQLAAYCNRQGWIEALLWLSRSDNGFIALLASELATTTLNLFKKYGAFSRLEFEHVQNPKLHLSPSLQTSTLTWRASDHLCLAQPVPDWVQQQKADLYWRAYWLALNIPCLVAHTQAQFRPHDLNLPELGAVCFSKGCYPGQEIVARTHYRGKPKQHMQRLWLNQPHDIPQPGQVLDTSIHIVDAIPVSNTRYAITAAIPDAMELPRHGDFGTLEAWDIT